jgi:ATP-binding cassette subfamily B protein
MLKAYRTLFPYIKKYRSRYALGILCLIAVDGAQLLLPQFVRRAIDSVASGLFDPSVVIQACASMLLVAAVIGMGRFLWRFFLHGSARRIEAELRDRLFSHLMTLSSSFYQENKIGDIMSRGTSDIGTIRQAASMGFVNFVDGSFMSLSILVIIFVQNPRVALFTVLPLPFVTALILVFGKLVGKRFQRMQERYAKLGEIAQETFSGVRVVKSFVKESHFEGKFAEANDRYRDSALALVRVFGLFFPLISFLSGLTTLILVAVGGAATASNSMSPGDLVAMLAYLEMLVWPMVAAGFTVNLLQRGAVSLKRIDEILDAKAEIVSGSVKAPIRGSIEARGLTFRYPGADADALFDVGFTLPVGKTLGVLGKVGSGKSTLIKLMARLWDPPAGALSIDGIDVRERDLTSLRASIGMVPQESFLFSDSLKANVEFGAPRLSAERFARACEIASIDRDVARFPDGWDTVVGERGLTLSGGQKQRVSIARALARDPEILVFDDALSAVDAETEERVLGGLLADRAGKTNVIVSHRVSTLRHADAILVLDGGKVAQYGTHDELYATEGFYRDVARLQELEDEETAAAAGEGTR